MKIVAGDPGVGLLNAVNVLSSVIQRPKCVASITKRIVNNTIHRPQIFKTCSTFYVSQHFSKVIQRAETWRNMVNPTNLA